MCAATRGKRSNAIRVRDFARLTLCHDQICARHRSPGHVRCARASPAIDAVTIAQRKGPTLQLVSCPAAHASTSKLHKIRLAHFNHKSTRITTVAAAVSAAFHPSFFRFQSSLPSRLGPTGANPFSFEKSLATQETPGHTRQLSAGKTTGEKL